MAPTPSTDKPRPPKSWGHDCIGVPGDEMILAGWIVVCPVCGIPKEKCVEEVNG